MLANFVFGDNLGKNRKNKQEIRFLTPPQPSSYTKGGNNVIIV
jgi:hypothetical protein